MGIFDFLRPRGPKAETESAAPAPRRGDSAAVEAVYAAVEALRRSASVAEVGGFRPPDDPRASWFGRGVGLPGETLPRWEGRELVPLLQINVGELPYVHPALEGTALLVLFMDPEDLPFDAPHGEGWEIREYASLDGLAPLPPPEKPSRVKPFPVRWSLVDDEYPGWEDIPESVDLRVVNADDETRDAFHDHFPCREVTRVGGYPVEIQGQVSIEGFDFVFQVGSEQKPGWYWADAGTAYFFKSPRGEWAWTCEFY